MMNNMFSGSLKNSEQWAVSSEQLAVSSDYVLPDGKTDYFLDKASIVFFR